MSHMEQVPADQEVIERLGVKFLAADAEMTPGAVEALNRRTVEELEVLAEQASNRL